MVEEKTWVADCPPLAENLRSYEQHRADDPMIVLEEEISDPSVDFPRGPTGPLFTVPIEGLTPDQQIRMKALECACRLYQGRGEWSGLNEDLAEFEDYLKNGRE